MVDPPIVGPPASGLEVVRASIAASACRATRLSHPGLAPGDLCLCRYPDGTQQGVSTDSQQALRTVA